MSILQTFMRKNGIFRYTANVLIVNQTRLVSTKSREISVQTPGGSLQEYDKSIKCVLVFLVLISSLTVFILPLLLFYTDCVCVFIKSPPQSLSQFPLLTPVSSDMFFCCLLTLSVFLRLGRRGAPSELKGDRSDGRQHGGEVLQLQHASNVSGAVLPPLCTLHL